MKKYRIWHSCSMTNRRASRYNIKGMFIHLQSPGPIPRIYLILISLIPIASPFRFAIEFLLQTEKMRYKRAKTLQIWQSHTIRTIKQDAAVGRDTCDYISILARSPVDKLHFDAGLCVFYPRHCSGQQSSDLLRETESSELGCSGFIYHRKKFGLISVSSLSKVSHDVSK
jgi:hypothetical protein